MSAPAWSSTWEMYWLHLRAERQLRRATVSQYRMVLYNWDRHLGERPWWKATTRQLDGFTDPAKLAPATRAGYTSIVCGFYRWATATGLIRKDPMAAVRIPKRRPPVPKALPLADVRTIQAAADHDERLRVAVALAYFAGMRAGELARAQVEDVHLGDQPRIVIPEGKGGRPRVVPLHPAGAAILAGYLSRRSGTGPLLDNRAYPGRPLTPSAVSSLLARLITELGIKGSAHSLRHSAATELLRASKGQAFEAVREFLGHSDGATTRRYTSSYDYDVAAAVQAMPDPRGAPMRDQPAPRTGNGLSPTSGGDKFTGLATMVPSHIADQLAAAVATLEQHGPAVTQAAETLGKATTLAWLATMGLSRPEDLAGVDPRDPRFDHTDEQWAECEKALGIDRGWVLAYALRDSIDD